MTTGALIDSIYEAAVSLDAWPALLARLAGHAGAKGGLLFASDQDGVRWVASPDTAALYAEFIRLGFGAQNNRVERLIGFRHCGFLTDSDVCSADEIATLPMYTQYLTPLGFSAAAATAIPGLSAGELILSVEGFNDHPASRAAVPMLDALRPHLARASMLAARFSLERTRAAVAALGLLGVPACVVGRGRRLIEANDMFQAQLSRFGRDGPSGLVLTDGRADAKLVFALTSLGGERAQGSSFVMALKSPASRAVLHVIPLRGTARDLFSGATSILAFTEPGRRAVPSADIIQDLLDLTPAEARLARSLVAGATLAGAADKAGISAATTRTQLRNIFDKTGMSRQCQLVAYLSNVGHPSA